MTAKTDYDLVVVGGGIGGSSLAAAMAGLGHSVLLLERETQFRDRIRGEVMMPWGSAEARRLGVYQALRDGGGLATPRWTTWIAGQATPPLDYAGADGEQGFLASPHPRLQEVLLRCAATAGAEVLRGILPQSVTPSSPARIAFTTADGATRRVSARLLVGAEGRSGVVAQSIGALPQRDPTAVITVGLELAGAFDTGGSVNYFLDPESALSSILVRTTPERCRVYLMHHASLMPRRLSGDSDRAEALRLLGIAGVPADWLAGPSPGSPLASFDGAWRWVSRPFGPGVVLIGDAAGSSDPAWGNGLSRTLRDVRLLRDLLQEQTDWNLAAEAFATAHLAFCRRLRLLEAMQAELFTTPGPAGTARRQRALGLFRADPTRQPDVLGLGPDAPYDETVRQRFLGEI